MDVLTPSHPLSDSRSNPLSDSTNSISATKPIEGNYIIDNACQLKSPTKEVVRSGQEKVEADQENQQAGGEYSLSGFDWIGESEHPKGSGN